MSAGDVEVARAPRCPACDQPPMMVLDDEMFCGTHGCQVLTWKRFDDPAVASPASREIS